VTAATSLAKTSAEPTLSAEEAEQLVRLLNAEGFRGNELVVGVPGPRLLTGILDLPPRSSGAPVEEIAKVEGVDGLWLGHFDLSCSLGIPGKFDHPDFQKAVARTAAAAKAAGIPLGRIAADAKEGTALYKQGFDMIAISGDVWLLQSALSSAAAALRQGVKG